MENLYFYPTLTEELRERAGFTISSFGFSYFYDDEYRDLRQKGKHTVKLEDSWESWKIEIDGLHLKREITIEYPEVLYGEKGLACKDAVIGTCIIWTNKTLTQMGTILPVSEFNSGAIRHIVFEYDFKPGEIQGDLELETVLYIKRPAEVVLPNEERLMNDSGVNVGVLDVCRLDFGSIYFRKSTQNSNRCGGWKLVIGQILGKICLTKITCAYI